MGRLGVLEVRGGVRHSSALTGIAAPAAVEGVSHSSGEILVNGFSNLQVALDNVSARLVGVESRVSGVSSPSLSGSVARDAVPDVSHSSYEIIVSNYSDLQAALNDITLRLTSVETAFRPIDGSCGTGRNICRTGVSNDLAYTDTSSSYNWRCDGLYGGRNSSQCNDLRTAAYCGDGVCNGGETRSSCSRDCGRPVDTTPTPSTPPPCDSSPSCTIKSTSAATCGATYPTGCYGGCNQTAGLTGGTTCGSGQVCSSNGRCVLDTCTPNPAPCNYKNNSRTNCGATYPVDACRGGCNTSAGLTGGTRCSTGQACRNGRCVLDVGTPLPPVNGVCNREEDYKCVNGSLASVSRRLQTWTCKGSNGGTDADCRGDICPEWSEISCSVQCGTGMKSRTCPNKPPETMRCSPQCPSGKKCESNSCVDNSTSTPLPKCKYSGIEELGCNSRECATNSFGVRLIYGPTISLPNCEAWDTVECRGANHEDGLTCIDALPDCSSARGDKCITTRSGCGDSRCSSGEQRIETICTSKRSPADCRRSVSSECFPKSSCGPGECNYTACNAHCQTTDYTGGARCKNNKCFCTREGSSDETINTSICDRVEPQWVLDSGYGDCKNGVCGPGTQTRKYHCQKGISETCQPLNCLESNKPSDLSRTCPASEIICCERIATRCHGNSVVTTKRCGTSSNTTSELCGSGRTCDRGKCISTTPTACATNPTPCNYRSDSRTKCGATYPVACQGGCNTTADLTDGKNCRTGEVCRNGSCVTPLHGSTPTPPNGDYCF